jgi:CBS domain-containing protein
MITTTRPLSELTAGDLMSREVITIHGQMSLQAAVHLLRLANVTGAPVVDESGQCIGVFSAVDLLHRVEERSTGAGTARVRACPYHTWGRLLNGQKTMICTLEEGSCPLQRIQPTMGGRTTAVCLLSEGVLSDQQALEVEQAGEVNRYMTKDVVTAAPGVRLPELARKMLDAHIHRVVITDEQGRPIGIVSATDILAAIAREDAVFSSHGTSHSA